jgi:hypothetical protein
VRHYPASEREQLRLLTIEGQPTHVAREANGPEHKHPLAPRLVESVHDLEASFVTAERPAEAKHFELGVIVDRDVRRIADTREFEVPARSSIPA